METLRQAQPPLYTLFEQTILGNAGQPEMAKTACHQVVSIPEN